jgi:hypothetical protein
MGIDIRLPIGILFSLLGLILAVYGLLADPSHFRQALDVNINLAWGIVLLAFGLVMLLLGRRGMRVAATKSGSQSSDSSGHR